MLEIERLSKRYGDRVALRDLTLSVPAGQVVGLLGPNGSGKTTAMRIVFGVIDADSGQIRYRGAPIDADVRRRFGYMPEERGLYPDMRVHDQLVYFARLAGLDRATAGRRADGLLERLGIADRSGDEVQKLSLGNQQRVQLAAALVHEPEALVLDEPFSGLDPLAVAGLSEIAEEAARAGRLVLFSSHQLDLVEGLCESVAVIDRGSLVMAGRVDELKAASPRRELRVAVHTGNGDGHGWAEGIGGVRIVSSGADGLRLSLGPGVEPLASSTPRAPRARSATSGSSCRASPSSSWTRWSARERPPPRRRAGRREGDPRVRPLAQLPHHHAHPADRLGGGGDGARVLPGRRA